jgi:hypothetical protein
MPAAKLEASLQRLQKLRKKGLEDTFSESSDALFQRRGSKLAI